MPDKLKFLCDDKRHLICVPYSIINLHKMAEELGIKKGWFHGNHYDIPKYKIYEIQQRCEKVSSKQIVNIIKGFK
jgi:hypothetical protein